LLADAARRKTGVWILTDQRFAFVEVRDHDQRETTPESTEDRLGLLKLHFDLPGKWSPDQEDRRLPEPSRWSMAARVALWLSSDQLEGAPLTQ
jgi:hypothetical protein